MNYRTIILSIVVILVLYFLYVYLFSDNTQTTMVTSHNAKTTKVISASSLPINNSTNYTYSIWMYINDWDYRYGQTKVVFGRTDSNNDPSPSVTLHPSINNLDVTLATYPVDSTNASQSNLTTCTITDVPLQKWTNIILTTNNLSLDVYLDGKLVKTCILPGVPKIDNTSSVSLTPDGGFSGYTNNFEYYARNINPTEAYNIYKSGYGGSGMLSSMFNKYRIKLSFVEDNAEVNSFEI